MYNPKNFIHAEDIKLSEDTKELVAKAGKVFRDEGDNRSWYGRCIFISWYCALGDCTFCYRSTPRHQKMHPATSRRSMGSILLEALFCKVFNWRIEFLTGGYGIMDFDNLVEVAKNVSLVYGEKLWLNLGVLTPMQLENLKPYVKGICSSLETCEPKVHKETCPNKPIEPYARMFKSEEAKEYKKSIAIIVGLGDTEEDMHYLFDFIEEHKLDRITLYALKPVRGTPFTEGPTTEEYLRRIALIRIRFPKLEIIAGTNLRRVEETQWYLKAGASAITKFPATKQFGTKKAHLVEEMMREEGRYFRSNLTTVPDMDWEQEIDALPIDEKYKAEMKEKLPNYLEKFRNPKDQDPKDRVEQANGNKSKESKKKEKDTFQELSSVCGC